MSFISYEIIRLTKMFLNEVPVDKYLSDAFPIKNGLKQGEASWPFFFYFV
jgi:hypothetical protein